jgi:uncharacterized membrane protein
MQTLETELTRETLPATQRIQSIDLLRGIIIVVMALDHVRDFIGITGFEPEDVTRTTPAWFATRWITHFCAPTFVFLAGTSAFLYGHKMGRAALQRFLLTRGAWLILIELTVVHFGITFDFFTYAEVQVIWVIGLSMLTLSAVIVLPKGVIVAITVIIIFGHNLLDNLHFDSLAWYLFHEKNHTASLGNYLVDVRYPFIPWPAVMMFGYLIGEVFVWDPPKRTTRLTIWGLSIIAFFIVIRLINQYGDPHHWSPSDRGVLYSFLDFINTTKYPPSLLYLAMTLGPVIYFLPKLERVNGRVANFFLTFGKVPFFFYIIHFYLAHLAGVVYNGLVYNDWRAYMLVDPKTWPEGYDPSLLVIYVTWALLIGVMYFLCKWFVGVKKRRSDWWLKYL